jgi:anti-sigma regulatory factor (Ser/Thr protein kinase)
VSRDQTSFTVLASSHRAPAVARNRVRSACEGWPASSVDVARLLASELVTNAVNHGHGDVGLRITRNDDLLRVEVSDANPELVNLAHPPSDQQPSGRGLRIIDALAASWGRHLDDGSGRKTVWFELQPDDEN